MHAVEAVGVSKHFRTGGGVKHALSNVSINIEQGSIHGILGPNGAGKTTLISILSTLATQDSGSVKVFGHDAQRERARIKNLVNISSGNPNFPWSLTVCENLRYYAMLYGQAPHERERSINEVISLLELEEHRDVRFEALSTGTKQRLSLAKALLNSPKLLFLDEPTMGLDPDISQKTRGTISRIHRERDITIVMTTHYMREAEQLCERIAFLRGGRLIADAPPGELKKRVRIGDVIRIRFEGAVDKRVFTLPGVLECVLGEGEAKLIVHDPAALDPVIRCFPKITDICMTQPDLEDVFLEFAKSEVEQL